MVNRMDDLISRQAAIDAAKKLLDYYGTNDISKEFADHTAERFMNRVPSVQPTADAVPVEYIFKQIVKLERSKGQSYHAICYRHLIEVWQMENEREEE